jgi:hypothetical protein
MLLQEQGGLQAAARAEMLLNTSSILDRVASDESGACRREKGRGTTYVVALAIALILLWILPNTLTSQDIIARLITSSAQAFGFGLMVVKTVQFIANKGHIWIQKAISEGIKNAATPLIFSSILYMRKGKIEMPEDIEEFKKYMSLVEQFSAAIQSGAVS